MTKVVVLGAGVVGVTSAYELARSGFEVEVIDAREGPGLETSYANGGQVAANHCEPWARPGVMWQAIKWLGRKDAPLLYHLRLDPALWAWSLRFMANATGPRFWANVAVILRVALYSRDALKELSLEANIEYDRLDHGILNIFRGEKAFADAVETSRAVGELGCERRVLNKEACIELEPALASTHDSIVGGTYSPYDLTGDAYLFTRALYERAREMGVHFRFNTRVSGLNVEHGKIKSAATSAGDLTGDVFVLALGCGSMEAVRGLGITM
ncbi:MAG: FAD-dependent oxidoreductase, partial [Rhodospirillaceae bacterium]|nr:FAD-dependent oxidoreductase [Rhodospirillaceae bacterium]